MTGRCRGKGEIETGDRKVILMRERESSLSTPNCARHKRISLTENRQDILSIDVGCGAEDI